MSAPMFETPTAGDLFKNDEHVGDLLVLKVLGTEEGVQTENGSADVIRADITIINDDGTVGDVFEDAMIFGKVVYSQFRRKAKRTFVGRWYGEPGVKRQGKNVPYELWPASEDEINLAVRAMTGNTPPAPAETEQQAPAATELPDDTPPWARG